MTDAVGSIKTSVYVHQTAWFSIPEDSYCQGERCFTFCSAHKLRCILDCIIFGFLILVRIKITVFWDWFHVVWYIGAIVFEECATSNFRGEAGSSRVIGNVGTVSTIPHGVMAINTDILNHSLMFYLWLTLVPPGCTVICKTLILFKKDICLWYKAEIRYLALFWQCNRYIWITCNKKNQLSKVSY